MNVLVLLGGDSSERDVSLRSGTAVGAALREAGFHVTTYDPRDGFEGLRAAAGPVDVVLPILHGDNGEDGVIQQQLEQLDKQYLGATSDVSRITINKSATHRVLEDAGIAMPRYAKVSYNEYIDSDIRDKSHVLKTVNGGSSVDILIVRNHPHAAREHAKTLFDKHSEMLVEELIEGLEVTVPVLDSTALPIIAIIPPKDGEFDYENKYNGQTQELCPVPEDLVSKETQLEAQKLAERVHKTLGVRHLSRTDMILAPNGQLYVLELNTIPGLTDQSLFPKSAAVAGIPMVKLVEQFVQMVSRS